MWDEEKVKTGKETNYLYESTWCDKHIFSQAVDMEVSRELEEVNLGRISLIQAFCS